MANFKVLALFLMAIFLCSGCSMKIHKDYAFTEPELRLDSGVIHAKLRGTMENIDNKTSVQHSPYEMLIWFASSNEQDRGSCLVTLDSMTLKNSETDEFVLSSEITEAAFRERSDGVYTASFSYKNLDLEYADHELEFKYSFGKGCDFDQTSAPVSMLLKKQYSERNISFWDALMGI